MSGKRNFQRYMLDNNYGGQPISMGWGNNTSLVPTYKRRAISYYPRYRRSTFGKKHKFYNRKPSAKRGFFKTSKFEKKYTDITLEGASGEVSYPDTNGVSVQWAYNSFDSSGTIYRYDGTLLHTRGMIIGLVPQGTGVKQRIGEKITMCSLYGKFNFAPNFDESYSYKNGQTSSSTPLPLTYFGRYNFVCRMLLVLDRANNGRGANPDEGLDFDTLFEFPTVGVTNWNGGNVWSPLSMANRGRYQILIDKTFHIDQDSGQRVTIEIKKKIKIPLVFSSTSGTQSEMRSNCLHLVFLHDGPQTANATQSRSKDPRVSGMLRMRYYDA